MIVGLLLFFLFGITHLTYNIDVYNEFIIIFFFTIFLYNILFYFLNSYLKSFNAINPSHKKMYVIKNYVKSFYLFCLCFTLPYFINGEYNILFIKRCTIYYIINDLIGLILVKKLPNTTIIHHTTTSLCGIALFMKSNNNLDILTLIVLYAIFSSMAFSVNLYLAYRVHSINIKIKSYLSQISLYNYILCCLINWPVQLYLFCIIFLSIPIYEMILYIYFLYSVMRDDIILMKWLYNDKIQYNNYKKLKK